ncbi:hypothetical protein KI440_00265 [Candidatus Saccharibacteria bacterium TM7i]|nr:hypothetical protein KI440_00265 [Candidatus Saccharibacteria bacterium TM7i]
MIYKVQEVVQRIVMGRVFLLVSIGILILVSCLVGYQGAVLQAYNFDQLIDNYMFESFESFSQAIFPAAHTFMLKWPIFALGGLLGNSQIAFIAITIIVQLITALGFIAIIYFATKKNKVVTSLMACLMSLLFLIIPIQEASGTVAPIGVAMITTRNIEYILYILAMWALVKSVRFMDKYAVLGTFLIFLLAASDKLLLYIALGSTVLWVIYNCARSRKLAWLHALPAVYVVLAAVASTILFKFINAFTTLTINEASSSISTVTQNSVSSIFNTLLDAVEAIVRNFGATIFGVQPGVTLAMGGLGLATAVLSVWLSIRIFSNKQDDNLAVKVGRMLVLSSLTATLLYIFVARDDGIAVRYLGIVLFTGTFVIALWLSALKMQKMSARRCVVWAVVFLLICIPAASLHAIKRTSLSIKPTEHHLKIDQIKKIANEVSERDVDLLVGIYYVATLARYQSSDELAIAPTKDYVCMPEMTDYLTTKAWYQPIDSVNLSALYVRNDGVGGTVNGGCTSEKYDNILGAPEDIVSVGKDVSLYLYSFDIREKLFSGR